MIYSRLSLLGVVCLLFAPLGLIADGNYAQTGPWIAASIANIEFDNRPLPKGALARISPARFRFGGPVHILAFSPDGSMLAAATENGDIALFQRGTGREIRRWRTKRGVAVSLSFSPDGKQLAATFGDIGSFLVWEAQTGNLIHESKEKGNTVVQFSPRGDTLAVSKVLPQKGNSIKGQVVLLDRNGWRERRRLPEKMQAPHFAISADGRHLALSSGKSVEEYETDTGKLTKTRDLPNGVYSLAYSPDGKFLAAAGEGKHIVIWNRSTGKETRYDPGQNQTAYSVLFHPKGDGLFVQQGPSTLIYGPDVLYSLARSEPYRFERKMQLVETQGLSIRKTFPVPASFGGGAPYALSPDGQLLVAGRHPRFWDVGSGKEIFLAVRGGGVAAFSRDGKTLLTDRHRLILRTADNMQIVPRPKGELLLSSRAKNLRSLPVSKEEQKKIEIFDLSRNTTAEKIDLRNYKPPSLWARPGVVYRGNDIRVSVSGPFALSPNREVLAAAGADVISLFDVRSQKQLRMLTHPDYRKPKKDEKNPVLQGLNTHSFGYMVFSPDGRYLAAALNTPQWAFT